MPLVVDPMLGLIQRLLGEDIHMVVRLANDLGSVEADYV